MIDKSREIAFPLKFIFNFLHNMMSVFYSIYYLIDQIILKLTHLKNQYTSNLMTKSLTIE